MRVEVKGRQGEGVTHKGGFGSHDEEGDGDGDVVWDRVVAGSLASP